MAFLELNAVEKWYGAHPVLRGLDLHVEKHEVVCLIGASGCGKSTLLRCVNALEEIQGGEIRLHGDVVSGEGVDVNALRRSVGIVFQSFNLFPHLTVEQNVTLAQRKVLKRTPEEASAKRHRSILTGFPGGSSSASLSFARSRCSPSCCCSTRSPRRSIRS